MVTEPPPWAKWLVILLGN